MGVLASLFFGPPRASAPAADNNFWYQPVGGNALSGTNISEDTARAISTVYRCVAILGGLLGYLPLMVYRRRTDDGKDQARNHPLWTLLHDQPNGWQTSFEWRELGMHHLLLRGNFYNEIVPGARGFADQLVPLHPDRVRTAQLDSGRLVYTVQRKGGRTETLVQDQVFHVRGPSKDGITGLDVITLMREQLGLATATEAYGARMFRDRPMMAGILHHPGKVNDEVGQRIAKSFQAATSGANAHMPALLEDGMKWESVGITPEDAQYLECVAPATLLTMSDGTRRPAAAIRAGDSIMAWNGAELVSAKVAAVGRPSPKPLVRIRTARGRELTASADHPVLALKRMRTSGGRAAPEATEWRLMQNLQVGHYVRVALGTVSAGAGMTFDEAYFLGSMAGNGYIPSGSCSWSHASPEVATRVCGIVQALGGNLVHRSGSDWAVLTGGSGRRGSRIRRLLSGAGLVGHRAHEKALPDSIIIAGETAWRGFLSGYFDADGSVRPADRKPQLAYWSSVSRSLLEGCQHLLTLLGIQSSLFKISDGGRRVVMGRECMARPAFGLYVMGVSELSRLGQALDLAHPSKRERLAGYRGQSSRYRAVNFGYDRVASVEVLAEGETIGIEVAGAHTHVTAGLITHNTQRFTVEQIARFFGVPLPFIGAMEKSTAWGTGIESLLIGFVIMTLAPWAARWQQAIARDLILAPDTYFAEFTLEAMLRGDTQSLYEAFQIATGGRAWMAPNEVRAKLNMNPVAGYDEISREAQGAAVGRAPAPRSGRPTEDDEDDAGRAELAARAVRRELRAMTKAATDHAGKPARWRAAVERWYESHAAYLVETLGLDGDVAGRYCERHAAELLASGVGILGEWEANAEPALLALAREGATP